MEATFFIDESGNTGTDWLNDNQPFFTYGGWLVPNDKLDLIEKYLKGYIEKEQSDELKSKNIFKRTDGLNMFSDIYIQLLEEFSAIPFFIVADKKFMIAAKIVETFFDYAYNPYVNEYLTHPVELKKALANCIINFHDKTIINSFAKLIKNGTISVDTLKEINLKLLELFESEGHEQVASTLKCLTEENFLRMIDEFETVTQNGQVKNRISLTQTMLLEILRNVELFSNGRNISVKVSHDRLRGYAEVFKEIEDIFLQEEEPFIYKNEGIVWLSRFPHINSIIEQDSKAVPCIQVSDLLCGFISKSFQSISGMKNLNKIEKGLLFSLVNIREVFIKESVLVWNWYAPYNLERKFILSLNPKAKVALTDYNAIIQRDFPRAIASNEVIKVTHQN